MSDKTGKALTPARREANKAFSRPRKAVITEYEQAQEAFQRNFRRLRAERLAREVAKSKDK
jgi:hypothetical protein